MMIAQAREFVFHPATQSQPAAGTGKAFTKDRAGEPHLAFIVTVAMSACFFCGQIRRLREAGFHVSFISSPGPELQQVKAEGAEVITISMEREIAVFGDLISLWRLWRTLQRIRPDMVMVGTPKAGLLGGLAARLAGVSRRLYTLHGLRLETARGWKRRLLMLMERVSCHNANYVRCVSRSLRQKAIQLGVLDCEKAYVLGAGSANGIDSEHYQRTPERILRAQELRESLGIPVSAPVIGFVGRFTRDKGFPELYRAYVHLRQALPELHLLLVGDFEDGDPVNSGTRRQIQSEENVHFIGTVADVGPYYHVMSVLALPSYREGLGQVSLEAQASGVPVVTTTATGAIDSVLDGTTGKLVSPGNEAELAGALLQLIADPERLQRMGNAAPIWVKQHFQQELIWDALLADYRRILREECGRRSILSGVIESVGRRSRQMGDGLWRWIRTRFRPT